MELLHEGHADADNQVYFAIYLPADYQVDAGVQTFLDRITSYYGHKKLFDFMELRHLLLRMVRIGVIRHFEADFIGKAFADEETRKTWSQLHNLLEAKDSAPLLTDFMGGPKIWTGGRHCTKMRSKSLKWSIFASSGLICSTMAAIETNTTRSWNGRI